MTEESKTPETTPGATAGESKPEHQSVGTDADRAAAKLRRKYEGQLAEANKRIADLEAKTKTEQEKAVDEAYKRGRLEVESLIGERETAFALERELLKRGLDPDLAPSIRAKAEIEKADDVPGAVDTWLQGREWVDRIKAPAPIQGQGGAPPKRDGSTMWTADRLDAHIRQHGERSLKAEDWKQIEKDLGLRNG